MVSEYEFLQHNYEKVKACPFCGSKNIIATKNEKFCTCSIYCNECFSVKLIHHQNNGVVLGNSFIVVTTTTLLWFFFHLKRYCLSQR